MTNRFWTRLARFAGATLATLIPAVPVLAQQPVPLTRAAAVAAALAHGPQLAVARADTAAAAAALMTARAFPDPLLTGSYSKDYPNYHLLAEYPLDFIWVHHTQVASAEAASLAARYRFDLARANLALGADTAYTRALATLAHLHLSRRNAADADSLRRIATARRNAGDASDLDVELATVVAGQQQNIAASDSLAMMSALLDLQMIIGLPADHQAVVLTDSLLAPPAASDPPADSTVTLPIAGAEASLSSAALALRAQHRGVFGVPALTFGFDVGNPATDQQGLLPTFGLAIPLPLFNRNRGPIAQADAALQRARAELDLAQIESRAGISRAERAVASARGRLARDSLLVVSADRVAGMSLTAYREGAVPLANVLEAERSARDILAQNIDDIAALLVADATLRALTLTPGSGGIP